MNPKMSRAHAAIGDALYMLGQWPEARAEYLAEPARDFAAAGLAVVEHKLGDRAAAERSMRAVEAEGDRLLYQQAQVWRNGASTKPRSPACSKRWPWATPAWCMPATTPCSTRCARTPGSASC